MSTRRERLIMASALTFPTSVRTFATLILVACHGAAPSESPARPSVAPPLIGQARAGVDDPNWAGTPTTRAAPGMLEIWASPYVASAGDTLDVFATARDGDNVDFQLDRIGWYDGHGARRVWSKSQVPVPQQEACSPAYPGPVECLWPRTFRLPLATDLQDGLYLIRGTNSKGMIAFYPFVVRASKPHAFLVVIPQFTWQAYNYYGGSSLYTTGPTGEVGHFVSFDRPYHTNSGATYLLDDFGSHELQVIRYLERGGYDIGYASDLDLTDAAPKSPVTTRAVLFAGHDEYWTSDEYDRARALRDGGTHLGFFAANNVYWHIRLGTSGISHVYGARLTCYKSATDPGASSPQDVTTRFRDPPISRPENELVGVMVSEQARPGDFPLIAAAPPANTEAATFLVAGGFAPQDSVPGVVGDEGDAPVSNGHGPRNLQIMFRSPNRPNPASTDYFYTTFYVAASGAGVFAAGNNEWSRGLDNFPGGVADVRQQRMTDAILQWMLSH